MRKEIHKLGKKCSIFLSEDEKGKASVVSDTLSKFIVKELSVETTLFCMKDDSSSVLFCLKDEIISE